MLIRNVLIDGVVYGYHELNQITAVKDAYVVATVESWPDFPITMGAEPHNTFVRLGFVDGLTFGDAEKSVWDMPEFDEWADTSEALEEVLNILTDEQAETVPQVFPEWRVDTEYVVGKRARYENKLYRCVQAHTSQEGWEPPNVPALWVRTAQDGEVPEWAQPSGSHDAYNRGDKVRHNGSIWVSAIDANVWEPGVYGWEKQE